MTPRSSYRILRAAWIMARAYTPHLVIAAFACPWALVSIVPGALRGGLYLDPSRTGMVLLYRSRTLIDMLIVTPVMLVVGLVIGAVVTAVAAVIPVDWATVVLWLATLLAASLGLVHLLPQQGGSMLPWGPETPAGQRWEVAGLAQMPGTHLTGIQLALRVIDEVPPAGAVIIATANSEKLVHQYRQFGFTGGPKHRVHKVVA